MAGAKKSASKSAAIKATAKSKAKAKPATKKKAKKPAKVKPAKKPAKVKAPKKPAKVKPVKKRKVKKRPPISELFSPLTEGERAETLRILLEDARLSSMAKVGRYRVIAVEPLAFKPGHELASQRIARVVIYDYSADRCVESNVDLDTGEVKYLSVNKSQPMLSSDEEVIAMEIALESDEVRQHLALGESPQATMHYWSNRTTDMAHNRRSAAVLFGLHGERPSVVAVVDLIDAAVTEIVPAGLW
jgi:Cu2+-containing amine oxidase